MKNLKCTGQCGNSKIIHCFPASDWIKPRPICTECRKAYRRSIAVKSTGGAYGHFCINAERVKT